MPNTDLSNAVNRFGPVVRSRKIKAVHLLPIISMAPAIHPTRGSIVEGGPEGDVVGECIYIILQYFTKYSGVCILSLVTIKSIPLRRIYDKNRNNCRYNP